MKNLVETMTSKELVTLYNRVTGQSVKRFADRAVGLKRVNQLLENPETKARLEEVLVSQATVATIILEDDVPLPTIAEALRAGLEAGAARQGVGTLDGPSPKPKPKAKDARPINDRLVAIGGRVVRKENVAKVVKGESLWGSVAAPPSEKDALKGHNRLNLNYPVKATGVKPMREGTKRHTLVVAMRNKGVTVEEVMAMFGITEDQAVYKLRDLHYMSGHGLAVRNGRVFVTDKS